MKHAYCLFYSDDTNLLFQHKHSFKLFDRLNHDLKLLTKWLKMNKLCLNIEKTHCMVFYRTKIKHVKHLTIFIRNVKVSQFKFTKFLGVIIDEKNNKFLNNIYKYIAIICKAINVENYY